MTNYDVLTSGDKRNMAELLNSATNDCPAMDSCDEDTCGLIRTGFVGLLD